MIDRIVIEVEEMAFYNQHHQFHRVKGPAIIKKVLGFHYTNNNYRYEEWRFNGNTHRLEEPAFCSVSSVHTRKQWYVHGIKQIT